MNVSEDRCVRRSEGVRNGNSGSTPGGDHPLIQEPVEGLQQGRRVVVLQSHPRPRAALGVSFPALGPRAGVVSDVAARNRKHIPTVPRRPNGG